MSKYDILAVMGVEHEGNTLYIDRVLEANTDPNDTSAYLALTALVHITGNPDKKYTLRIEDQHFHDTFIASTFGEEDADEPTDTETEAVLVYPGIITEDTLQAIQRLPEGFLAKYLTVQEED